MKRILKQVIMLLLVAINGFANSTPNFIGKNFTASVSVNKNMGLDINILKEKSYKLKVIIKSKDEKVFGQEINENLYIHELDIFSKEYIKTIGLNNLQDGKYVLLVSCKNENFKYNFTISTKIQTAESHRVLE